MHLYPVLNKGAFGEDQSKDTRVAHVAFSTGVLTMALQKCLLDIVKFQS